MVGHPGPLPHSSQGSQNQQGIQSHIGSGCGERERERDILLFQGRLATMDKDQPNHFGCAESEYARNFCPYDSVLPRPIKSGTAHRTTLTSPVPHRSNGFPPYLEPPCHPTGQSQSPTAANRHRQRGTPETPLPAAAANASGQALLPTCGDAPGHALAAKLLKPGNACRMMGSRGMQSQTGLAQGCRVGYLTAGMVSPC